MIISHKYRLIFVKTVKTAGTSWEVYLSQHCSAADIVTPINPPVESHVPRNYQGIWNPFPELLRLKGHYAGPILGNLLRRRKFHNHMPAVLIEQRVSAEVWNGYFKFCIERNPWDMALSNYHMMKYRSGGRLSFDDYMRQGKFRSNYHLYTNSHGELMVDRVIKYESLLDELAEVFRELGIPFAGTLGVRAKSEYRENHAPYQQIFSEEQKEIIEKAFRREIRMHGYSF